ncbi:hypothetical protein C7S18_10215 [Ahniella affigens]|uniref:Uncharacterized protein n=1 Tax=Ahniella affigens TaxID=2021234 RepID=A0A2P1PRR7_9GAMM|nr:hypothetical protein C7S18_10215 [Ahniella affigens]
MSREASKGLLAAALEVFDSEGETMKRESVTNLVLVAVSLISIALFVGTLGKLGRANDELMAIRALAASLDVPEKRSETCPSIEEIGNEVSRIVDGKFASSVSSGRSSAVTDLVQSICRGRTESKQTYIDAVRKECVQKQIEN